MPFYLFVQPFFLLFLLPVSAAGGRDRRWQDVRVPDGVRLPVAPPLHCQLPPQHRRVRLPGQPQALQRGRSGGAGRGKKKTPNQYLACSCNKTSESETDSFYK